MKLIYLVLFSGFLLFGCSMHPKEIVVSTNQKTSKQPKPGNTNSSRLAKEFPLQSNVLSKPTAAKRFIQESTPLCIKETIKPIDRRIILELPEGESLKKQINITDNQSFIIQRIKAESCFSLTFENDIFDMTDRYYTNGLRFEWSSPSVAHSPVSRLMLSYGHPATNTYSVYLTQNMYTPISTKIPPALSGNDRPYSAYMILGHRKESTDATRQLKFTNDIILGVIGSYSLGSLMQQGVHKSLPTNDPPLGWETQISNDVIAGYRLQVEKNITGGNQWQAALLAAAEAGTLYDNLMAGFRIEAGKNMFYRNNQSVETIKQSKQKVKLHAYFQGESRIIGYDATLQGGMFNHNNIYTLTKDEIDLFVLKAETGFSVRYLQYGLELGQTIISPEYTGGRIHKWGRITLNLYFR